MECLYQDSKSHCLSSIEEVEMSERGEKLWGWEGIWRVASLPGKWLTWISKMLSPRLFESENQFLVPVTQIRSTYQWRSWLASFFYYQIFCKRSHSQVLEKPKKKWLGCVMPKSIELKRAPNLPFSRVQSGQSLTIWGWTDTWKAAQLSTARSLRQASVTITSWHFISAVTSFLLSVTPVPTGQT